MEQDEVEAEGDVTTGIENLLREIRTELAQWNRWPHAEKPALGSQLSVDDAKMPWLPVSTIVGFLIDTAFDHLRAADALIRLPNQRSARESPFTVLRAATLAGVQAVYVLDSEDSEVRVGRALQLANEDYRQLRAVAQLTGTWEDKRWAGIQGAYAATRDGLAKRGLPERVSDTQMVEHVARVFERREHGELIGKWLLMEWRLAGGSAHGRHFLRYFRGDYRTIRIREDLGAIDHRHRPQDYEEALVKSYVVAKRALNAWDARR